MLIAWGAMPESTTGAKSRLVHAGAMPMRWGAATQRGRGAMPIEAGIAHIGCIPNFSTPVFDFFLVWPYKNRVFSFFSLGSSRLLSPLIYKPPGKGKNTFAKL